MRQSRSVITGLSIVAALTGCVSAPRENLPEPKAPAEKMQQRGNDSFDEPVPDVISINRVISFVLNKPQVVSKQMPLQAVMQNRKVNERA